MASYNLDKQVFENITQYAINRKKIAWVYIESVCRTFDDILELVQHAIKVGAEFSGFPSERTEKYLKSNGIKLENLK